MKQDSLRVTVITVLTSALATALAGCSTPQRQSFSPVECNEAAAQDRGFSEGRRGMDPDSAYSFNCREDLRAQVRTGYQRGFDKGRAEYKERMKEQARLADDRDADGDPNFFGEPTRLPSPAAPATGSLFNCDITTQGRGFQASEPTLRESREEVLRQCGEVFGRRACSPFVRCVQAPMSEVDRYACSVEAFGTRYDGVGPTQFHARRQAEAACLAAGHAPMFCQDDAKCGMIR